MIYRNGPQLMLDIKREKTGEYWSNYKNGKNSKFRTLNLPNIQWAAPILPQKIN